MIKISVWLLPENMEEASKEADAALVEFLETYDRVCALQETLAQHMSNVRRRPHGDTRGRQREERTERE